MKLDKRVECELHARPCPDTVVACTVFELVLVVFQHKEGFARIASDFYGRQGLFSAHTRQR